ncbi:hypothetical protein [Banggai cardinalfish iridovirus]|uniref:Uncharacterized protein n=1 Tax=Banggai cardinalfish iridovirus TaxID=565290 RepID=A0A6M3QVV6_ISKNV|nr:hypothetical protein [Banggai cardinalfish iridovirus]UWH18842.1 ORF055 [Infectious spleen and kidney necrosis virus]
MDIVKVPLVHPDILSPVPDVSGLDLKLHLLAPAGMTPSGEGAADASADVSADTPAPLVEDEAITRKRNDLLFRRAVLVKMFPSATIPEITAYSDPEVMSDRLASLTRELQVDQQVSEWKRYIVLAVCAVEVILGKLNIDMRGFAHQQIQGIKSYDSLLAELVEKNQVVEEEKSSVEVRLLIAMGTNVVLFVLGNLIKSGGIGDVNLVDMFLPKEQ